MSEVRDPLHRSSQSEGAGLRYHAYCDMCGHAHFLLRTNEREDTIEPICARCSKAWQAKAGEAEGGVVMGDIANETFVVRNKDGSASLDPYARKSREELKRRCGELCRALNEWQFMAMALYEGGKGGLFDSQKTEIENLIKSYRD